MTEVVIDNKKYVFVPVKNYQALQNRAALKVRAEKTLTLEQARQYSKKLFRIWSGGK